ncbi:MAG: hypothetical protein EU549_03110 [Promethearchaeota archaeon]|nr:MAG: hypothetical protein EU549_03110 [Candidatus Lokiarchaeota archaeon]
MNMLFLINIIAYKIEKDNINTKYQKSKEGNCKKYNFKRFGAKYNYKVIEIYQKQANSYDDYKRNID